MAWEWGHSIEAYQNGRENLARMDRTDLNIIYAEWKAADSAHIEALKEHETEQKQSEWIFEFSPPDWDGNGFDEVGYNDALKEAETLAGDTLVAYIWERAETFSTCDNGGFNLWVCSHGCHTVSCDLESEECA